MADIPIQQKVRRPVWPWIIALIVLALLVWLFAGRITTKGGRGPGDTTSSITTPTTPPGTMSPSDTANHVASTQ